MAEEVQDPLDQLLRPGGLTLLLQPIIDLRPQGQLLHGVECMARGPEGSALGDPRALGEAVRRRGAEAEADRLCVAQALHAAAELPEVPRFSLNVHARTLVAHPTFTGFLLDGLRRYGLAPSRITLDVARSRSFGAPLYEVLDGLRGVGLSIAIDEVGVTTTDYERLVECRPDYLKVDRSFVRRDPPDYLRDLMLESVSRLARGMGAQAVAQGVESLDELDAAMAHGVNLVQGKFFGEPMTLQALRQSGVLSGRHAA